MFQGKFHNDTCSLESNIPDAYKYMKSAYNIF